MPHTVERFDPYLQLNYPLPLSKGWRSGMASSETTSQGQESEKTVDVPPSKLEKGKVVDDSEPGDLKAWLTVLGG